MITQTGRIWKKNEKTSSGGRQFVEEFGQPFLIIGLGGNLQSVVCRSNQLIDLVNGQMLAIAAMGRVGHFV
jgi:hypothetical protein